MLTVGDVVNDKAKREAAIKVALQVTEALLNAVRESGQQGMQAGALYVACSTHGMPFSLFRKLMNILVEAGKVKMNGNRYYYVQKKG